MNDSIFPFPVAEKVSRLDSNDVLWTSQEKTKSISKIELFKTMLIASNKAWQEAIEPRMDKVRHAKLISSNMKGGGLDFFTEADTSSEEVIKKELISQFGKDAFRIFGEEESNYIGNLESEISIRIDPIDGTECFKFSQPSWSIMIGVYVGRGAQEKEVMATIYYPEVYNEVIYYIEGVGVFISNNISGKVTEITHLDQQNELSDIVIAYWRHSNLQKRGNIDQIIKNLEEAGARLRGTSPAAVREALITGGRKAMIMDGDYNQVDYISYSILCKLGYKVYGWDGTEYNIDDPNLTDKKVVLVPPGKVGDQILAIIRK